MSAEKNVKGRDVDRKDDDDGSDSESGSGADTMAAVRMEYGTKPRVRLELIELFSTGTPQHEKEANDSTVAKEQLSASEGRHIELIAEAALFMCGRGMRADELGKLTGIGTRNARKALDALVVNYASWRKIHGLEVVRTEDDRYLMRVRDEYLPQVKGLTTLTDISEGEMRTLSLIATDEPVLQSYVVKVRGNKAYYQIRRLMGKGLIKTEPRGRSAVVTTTRKFAEYFGKSAREIKRSLEAPPPAAKVAETAVKPAP